MSDGIGGTAQWLAGVAVGASIICWGVLPAMVGLGTQRSPENGDLAKPGDLAQWGAANLARISGDFAVTFMPNRAKGRVAGSSNIAGDGRGNQFLPQTYTLPQTQQPASDLTTPIIQTSVAGGKALCAGTADTNCDGLIDLSELEAKNP
jgi:hypothetical protein